MGYRKPKGLKHVALPITGHTVIHIETEPLPSLVFVRPDGLQSQLRFEQNIILTRPIGGTAIIPAFDANAAQTELSTLMGQVVTEAVAHNDGNLEISFNEGTVLQVHPDTWEAWHFQQPAPKTRPLSHTPHFSLTGYDGGLI
jgi:hypothetical protein